MFFFLAQGAEINPLDKESRSPLLLAASRTGWRTVLALIRLGANIHLKDANQRNVLTLVVMNGGRLEDFAEEVIKVRLESSNINISCFSEQNAFFYRHQTFL